MKFLSDKTNLLIDKLLELSKEAVLCFNINNNQILKTNELANKLYGYDENEFSTLCLSNIFQDAAIHSFIENETQNCAQRKKDGTLFHAEIQIIGVDAEHSVLVIKGIEKEVKIDEYYKNLYERLEETNRIVRQIDEIASAAIGEEYFQSIVNALSKILDADYVFITEARGKLETAKILYSSAKGGTISNIQYELAGTPCENVFSNNVCVYTRNIQKIFPADISLVEMDIEAYAGVPIPIRDIDEKSSRWILVALFSNELKDKEFYEYILMLFAQKIQAERERSNLLKVIQASAIESKKFRDIILKLTLDQDLIQGNRISFFSKVTEQLAHALQTERVGVWLFDNNNKELVCINLYGISSKSHTKGERITAKEYPRYFRAILEEHCIYADDACTDLRTIEFRDGYLRPLGISSMLDAGIVVRGRLLGVICSEHVGTIRNWTADEITFVNTISSLISNTIINNEYILLNQEYMTQNQYLKELIEVHKEAEIAADFGTWKWSVKDDRIIWSDNMCRIHDISPQEFGGTLDAVVNFVHPEDRAFILDKIQEMIQSKTVGTLEYRIQTAKGVTKYVEGASRAYFDENQNIVVVWGSVRDITEQKEKEKELLESQIKYKDLFDNIKDGMCILSAEGTILHYNKAFPKILGYDEEDLKTLKIPDIVHPEQFEISKKQHEKLITEGSYENYETRIISKDGSIVWIQVSSNAIYDEHRQLIASNDIIRDITARKKAEIELLKMREILEETSRMARVGGWEIDLVQQKLFWTDVIKEIYEVPLDYEPDIKNMRNFFKEDKAIEAGLNARITGESYDMEFVVITAKGNEVWVRTIGKAEMKDGRCIRLYGALQDITQQKTLEQELAKANETEFAKLYHQQKVYSDQIQQKNKELDRFFELSMDTMCILGKNGIVQRINPVFFKILGYSEMPLSNLVLDTFRHPDDGISTKEAIAKIKPYEGVTGFINRYLTKEGDIRTFSWDAVHDPDSEVIYTVGRDITQEKKARQEIEDLKYTLDQTAIVMVVGRDGKIISVNDKFCEISGYSKQEIIGQHHEVLDSNYHSKDFWSELFATIESGEIWEGEIKERGKDGSFYWTHTSSVPFFDENGKVIHYIVIQSDITNRKQLEIDLRNAEETAIKNAKIKEDFLANMSHEIRTPMNAVLGFFRLLLQTTLDKNQYDYAQAIYNSAENLLVIVNDILDFSKIESGKLEIEKISFDFRKTILSAVNTLKISIENKKIDFITEISTDIPTFIVSAPNRIIQVLLNLIGNAIKFTNNGYIKLKISLKDNGLLLFEVEDTGIGIAADKLDFIFESFTQAENYTTRMYGGTGLGLSISKKLVSLMGGEISVKSQVGKGSTFFFTLPFVENQSIGIDSSTNQHQIENFDTQNVKLLVVDDNQLNRKLVSIYLNMLQCVFDMATNGKEALELVAKTKYDLILMDIQMPIMDGIEATILIRQKDTSTPIIAMTAHAFQKEKQRCFDIGMNDYLAKPFKKENLEAILIKHIAEKIKSVELGFDELEEKELVMDNAVLGMEQLKEEVGDNKAIIHHLLQLFQEEIRQFGESLQKAIVDENTKGMGQLAHKIKPNFQLFQLNFLTEILAEIERLSISDLGNKLIYEHCKEVLRYIPMIQLQISEELLNS